MPYRSLSALLSATCFLSIVFPTHGQKINESFEYLIRRTNLPIEVDGSPDDSAWSMAPVATNFHQVLPMDTSAAIVRTEVRMLYDDEQLYLLAVNHEQTDGSYMVESLRRDFNFGRNDNFLLFLDPFDDQLNGFTFGSNALGAQWDGLLYDGGKADLSWENKWRSAVYADDDRWVFEMAVPFKTLRYKEGIDRWGVNFSRLDLKTTEKSAWAPVPRQFPTASLAYTGVLKWEEAPPPAGRNISVIPYVLTAVNLDKQAQSAADWRGDIGADAKVALSSSLNLDLTVNPDFSQVEVDVQQTNLDRFELFFPERRQFFLENADLFGNFGYSTLRPFFSRRIGLDAPIRFGARASGKINKAWRIGAMNMQTGKVDEDTPARNFSVLSLQRRVFARSNVSAIFVNKETMDWDALPDKAGTNRYNRNAGLEYNLASSNNKWTGKLLYLKSFTPGISDRDQIVAGNLAFNAKSWFFNLQAEHTGRNFRAETGFVPRTGYNRLATSVGRIFFPKSGRILSHGPSIMWQYYFDENMRYVESELPLIYRVSFLNRSELTAWTAYDFQELLMPFDPTNFSGDTLATGTRHVWKSFGGEFVSRPQRLFTWSVSTRYGGYYANGTRFRLGGEVGYRFQPYVAVSMATQLNRIEFGRDGRLPAGLTAKDFNLWLVGPRIDVTLTNKLFFTNFVQYNNQARNINLNLRMQWRYSPASDLFIVYTNNYFSDFSGVRNQALVLKLNYWWNV
ncbi:MAG: hypothetical protein RLY31_1885 [Bacteroidota bacterium]|jgi:hypothetical protein